MSHFFSATCDDFSISARLFLKLDLALSRETVLHFFDRIRKEYPSLARLRRRSNDSLVLEENAQADQARRWIRLERDSLRLGCANPQDLQEAKRFGQLVFQQAPYHLTLGDLDYDHLEVIFGFELEYEGNHDQLVAETLFADHPIAAFLLGDEVYHAIDAQPFYGVALSPACDIQAYLELKSRTSSYEVRTGQYEAQPLGVCLTLRRYWGFGSADGPEQVFEQLFHQAEQLAADKAVPLVVAPLAQAIASRS
jgi:hypothetical protein